MDDFIQAIESALESKNWYAALIVALCIPDICGHLEDPGARTECRYERWFERYMLLNYKRPIGAEKRLHTFLSPSDCYALRCALIHEGRDLIMEQKARKALDKFHFVTPPPWGSIHCNQSAKTLQLQVDEFCREIIAGIKHWLDDVKVNSDIEVNMKNIIKIHPPDEPS